jgi:hypothetical protein
VRTLVTLILLGSFVACTKPEAPPAQPETGDAVQQESGLEHIPEPDPAKYPSISDLAEWKNPQLVVREDGIGLVDVENHEIHILTQEQVPAELVSLPIDAWPYGRVVLLTQAMPKGASEQVKAKLRENRGLLMGTLKELQVKAYEAP